MFAYPATVEQTARGDYLISLSDFPDLLAIGHSLSEAIMHAEQMLNQELARMFFARETLPKPSKRKLSQIMIYLKRDILMTWHEINPTESVEVSVAQTRSRKSRGGKNTDTNEFH